MKRLALQTATGDLPPLRFILPGLLAGSVGMVAGPGGTGKSTILLQTAAALALAQPFPLAVPGQTKQRVALITGEDCEAVLLHRVAALVEALATLQSRPRDTLATELEQQLAIFPVNPRDCLLMTAGGAPGPLHETLRQIGADHDVVVIDPLRRFHLADENDPLAMATLVQLLDETAAAAEVTIVLGHRGTKAVALAEPADPHQAPRSATALIDAVRWLATLTPMSRGEASRRWATKVPAELDTHRRPYIRLGFVKMNYAAAPADVWFERSSTGQLAPTTPPARKDAKPPSPHRHGKPDRRPGGGSQPAARQ